MALSSGFLIFLSFLTVFLTLCQSKSTVPRLSTAFAGPYRIKVENFIDCEMRDVRGDIAMYFQCSQWKGDKDCKHMTGNITFARDFQDFPMVNAMYPWRDNQWKKDGVIMKFNKGFAACNNYFAEPCALILRNQTSFSKGVFMVDNPVKVSAPTIPVFPYGRWKALMYGNERYENPVFCLGVILNIVPK